MSLTRRNFLQATGAAGVLAATPTFVLPAAAGAATSGHTLVLVVLRGGLDGLSAVVPRRAAGYRDQRAATAIPEGSLHPLDENFAFHPALSPLLPHYRSGLLAPVVAVGGAMPSRSHFDQQTALDVGSSSHRPSSWLTRHLSMVHGQGALRAMGTGRWRSHALRGAPRAAAIDALDRFGLEVPDARVEAAERAFLAAAGSGAFGTAAREADAIVHLTRDVVSSVEPTNTDYGGWRWSRQFRDVATMVRADVGVEAAVIDLHGWDTHTFQGADSGQLATRLGDLAQGLDGLLRDLAHRLDRTTVVVVSEFGRRVQENANAGTDHGRGGVALVAGRGIRGGRVHGDWPGLGPNDLDDGDVRVTTDVRDVFAEIVAGRLGNGDLGSVFPDHAPRFLGLT